MNAVDISVILAAAAAIAAMAWYFLAPRRAQAAQLRGGVQNVEVVVRGGYRPDVIRVRQGTPVELVFDRQETGDCASRVVFPDFAVSSALPAHARTAVRLDPQRAGTFGFACGINMIHGTVIVEPVDAPARRQPSTGPGPGSTRRAGCCRGGGRAGARASRRTGRLEPPGC